MGPEWEAERDRLSGGVLIKPEYEWIAAGQSWIIPWVSFKKLPDGSYGLTEREIRRCHKIIARRLLDRGGPFSVEEREFLEDVEENT